jgi:hypothetical protein
MHWMTPHMSTAGLTAKMVRDARDDNARAKQEPAFEHERSLVCSNLPQLAAQLRQDHRYDGVFVLFGLRVDESSKGSDQ